MHAEFPNRAALEAHQLSQLRALLAAVLPVNPFYTRKFAGTDLERGVASLEEFRARAPFTAKEELVEDQRVHPLFGTNLTYPLERYVRCHQTSGTTGTPLRWLDTAANWDWMLDGWEIVHRVAGTTAADRIFFAFSFGPFIGFWLAFEAATRLGCLVLPGGGMSSAARLKTMMDLGATVLCCTPTYALHLVEVAAEEKIDLRQSKVRILNVVGEPGGSIPAVRQRLEQLWPGARVYDHHGMTEVGPVTFECPVRAGVLHVIESAYLAEVIHVETLKPVEPGQTGELVLTTLGRVGSPLLRYRTGDFVKPVSQPSTLNSQPCLCGRHDLALEGGILGRTDDMVVVRGVNVFPSAVEEIGRACGGVAEYQVTLSQAHALVELRIQIEPGKVCSDVPGLVHRLERDLNHALALRVPVSVVPPGTLPRFEMKARRWRRI